MTIVTDVVVKLNGRTYFQATRGLFSSGEYERTVVIEDPEVRVQPPWPRGQYLVSFRDGQYSSSLANATLIRTGDLFTFARPLPVPGGSDGSKSEDLIG